MRLGTSYTAIIVGSNLGLLMMFDVTFFASVPDHHRVPTTAPVPARLAGQRTCYQLRVSKTWEWVTYPERIELIDSVAPFFFRGEVWRSVIGQPEDDGLIARWATAGPDSISLWYEAGMPIILWPGPDAIVHAAPISCAEFTRAARRARSGRF